MLKAAYNVHYYVVNDRNNQRIKNLKGCIQKSSKNIWLELIFPQQTKSSLTEPGVTKAEQTAICTVDDSMDNVR
jgi:hypothetical protein